VKSRLELEPASQHDIFVMESTEQDQVSIPGAPPGAGISQADTTILYVGTRPHVPVWWKPTRSVSSNEGCFLWSDTLAESLAARLREKFSSISGIEKIFVRRDKDFYRVWTVIPDMDIDLEDRIYDTQLAIIDLFPETKFDFSVVFRRERGRDWFSPYGAAQIFPSR
jgi:hypothetical protein